MPDVVRLDPMFSEEIVPICQTEKRQNNNNEEVSLKKSEDADQELDLDEIEVADSEVLTGLREPPPNDLFSRNESRRNTITYNFGETVKRSTPSTDLENTSSIVNQDSIHCLTKNHYRGERMSRRR